MFKKIAAGLTPLAITLLAACGGTSGDANSQSNVIPTVSVQAVVGSNGDLSKYLGSWSSCTAQPNGQFNRNNIQFSMSGQTLLFTPSIGLVGTYSDAACTQAVLGQVVGISPIVPLQISATQQINISQQAGSQFTGSADQFPDMGQPNFQFAGFNAAYTSIWFSQNNSFTGTVVRYNKN